MSEELFRYIKTAGKHRLHAKKVLTEGDIIAVAFVEDLKRYGDASTWKALDKPAPSRGLIEAEPIPVPRIWAGEDVFIIGGGPSVAGMDLELIHDRNVIGVNQAFELGSWVDVLFFVDDRWMVWNEDAVRAFPNMKLAATGLKRTSAGVKLINRDKRATGISKTSNTICYNFNGGAAAISLAVHMGASRIFLIGFDMKVTDGKHNWHDKHMMTPKEDIYASRFLASFADIKRDADEIGIEIINLSPDSALNDFKKGTLEDYV